MIIWLTIIAAGILTYATRLSFISALRQDPNAQPDRTCAAVRASGSADSDLLPGAALNDGDLFFHLATLASWQGCWLILVAWRTKNVIYTIVIGMLALWILQLLFS